MENLDIIEYTYNWNNKLHTPCHTTLRLRNDEKYKRGKKFREILIKNKIVSEDMGVFYIEDIKHMKIDAINEYVARLDTGYSREKCIELIQTMYKNKKINWEHQELSLILLVRVPQ